MSQISKCPTLRVVLGYWEALGEVSEMRYNNLLYSSSKRSYCSSDNLTVELDFLALNSGSESFLLGSEDGWSDKINHFGLP